MELPIISSFIEGIKLFFENKRLKWLTVIFFIGLLITGIVGAIGLYISESGGNVLGVLVILVITGGIWPVFFLLASFMTLIRLQRFVASDESYAKSVSLFIPWIVLSFFMLFFFATMFLPIFEMLIFGVAFIGWIMFQAYFSTRTALKYGGSVDTTSIPKGRTILSFISNIFCYFVIIGALAFVVITNLVELVASPARVFLLIIGTLFALMFNFLNSIIMARYKGKATMGNLALIGLFISLYSAYFIYNAGKPIDTMPDLVSIAISIFFVFYTMSSVGSTLTGRTSETPTFRIPAELAATLTFFMASGYYFADILFPVILPDPSFGASLSDLIKLMLFPFIALVMELIYLRRTKKAEEVAAEHPFPTEPETEPLPTPDAEPSEPLESYSPEEPSESTGPPPTTPEDTFNEPVETPTEEEGSEESADTSEYYNDS